MSQKRSARVFSHEWFFRCQDTLLEYLDKPIVGNWLKNSVLKLDLPKGSKVIELNPDDVCFEHPDGTRTWRVYSGPVIARRLASNLGFLWNAAHAWDMSVANTFAPALNLGFDSLKRYQSDANPEVTTVDGFVARSVSSETYPTIINGAGTTFTDSSSPIQVLLNSSATTNQFAVNRRGIFLIDFTNPKSGIGRSTGPLLNGMGINNLRVKMGVSSATTNNLGAPDLVIVTSNPASNTGLANADYAIANFGTTALLTVPNASVVDPVNVSTLGTPCFDYIMSIILGGDSGSRIGKFGLLMSWDYNASFGGTWASSQSSAFSFTSAEGLSSSCPAVEIDYTPATLKPTMISNLRPKPFAPGLAR